MPPCYVQYYPAGRRVIAHLKIKSNVQEPNKSFPRYAEGMIVATDHASLSTQPAVLAHALDNYRFFCYGGRIKRYKGLRFSLWPMLKY